MKCYHCNIVINELLSFVQNKVDILDEESLMKICGTAFSPAEIEEAKKLLFESIKTEKMTTRKGENKTLRNLEDIINLIKKAPENTPIFVAKDLQKLPPITFDHVDVTRLLKDLLILNREVKDIKENYATVEYVKEIEKELKESTTSRCLDNINSRRGRYYENYQDSGPVGLFHEEILDLSPEKPELPAEEIVNANDRAPSYVSVVKQNVMHVEAPRAKPLSNVTKSQCASIRASTTTNASVLTPVAATQAAADTAPRSERERVSNRPAAAVASSGEAHSNVQGNKDDWQTVIKKKKWASTKFTGYKGTAVLDVQCKFKAAAALTNTPIYIYNVSKEVNIQDIKDYILEKTCIRVSPEKITMYEKKDYDSYKMLVPKDKLDLFFDSGLWPSGIYFRRYFKLYKSKKETDTT